uniref:tRNA-specific adenosine deaminase 1 n=1 Tax=Homalodisca liturata TaxID=320908 RepID=A0A1B6IU95_9HEMI
MRSDFADEIAKKCLAHYQNLPKKGKPVPDKEWTLLSSVVTSLDRKLSVVAMATGTKCLGRSGMSPRGDLVNDSHAEVLARRCFLRYLYDQISKFKQTGDSDIITGLDDQHRYEINSKVEFHFYTSHVPCGDAAIIPKEETCKGKRKLESNEEVTTKRKRMDAVQPNKTECSRDIVMMMISRPSRCWRFREEGCRRRYNGNTGPLCRRGNRGRVPHRSQVLDRTGQPTAGSPVPYSRCSEDQARPRGPDAVCVL